MKRGDFQFQQRLDIQVMMVLLQVMLEMMYKFSEIFKLNYSINQIPKQCKKNINKKDNVFFFVKQLWILLNTESELNVFFITKTIKLNKFNY